MKTTEMLLKTGFLHTPLPLADFIEGDISKQRASSEIYKEMPLTGKVTLAGKGELKEVENGYYAEAELHLKEWPPHQQPDGDYANFGHTGIQMVPDQSDWRGYTRIRFKARATGIGNRCPHIYVHLKNSGEVPMPDEFFRTGTHQLSLEYGKWIDCIWEIAELPRDRITHMDITLSLNGSDNEIGKTSAIEIRDLKLQETVPYRNLGWACQSIAFSQSGYRLVGKKTAVTMRPCETFQVEEKCGKMSEFAASAVEFRGETYYVLDFSAIEAEGEYRIKAAGETTAWFAIEQEPFLNAAFKMCNFIYCERCGYPVPTKHGICHCDVTIDHNGKKLIYSGGWHDAGDLSQQTLQTGEISASLYHAAAVARKAGDTLLADRLYEEARWGMAFVMKTRFGDGYRASSAGLTRYTHGFLGDMDDVTARCHNNPFENLLFSAIESDASDYEKDHDLSLSDQFMEAAREDFWFGVAQMPNSEAMVQSFFEHSYNSGRSLHLAAAIYAGANLLKNGFDEKVYEKVCEYTDELLACQETGDQYALSGFFYRDSSKVVPVHFNHQSREHLYAQGLASAYAVLSGEKKEKVFEAIGRYAGYMKGLMTYASPYSMIPAGMFLLSEAEDAYSFPRLHLAADFHEQRENMIAQIKNGTPVGNDAYVRQFPVWFSFRGNAAVLLSQGVACRILGDVLEDKQLHDIADEQLYFMVGKNPFAQSLVYGEGSAYAPQYAANPGEMIGEIPVGIETDGNADEPFYPEAINATYKEVWTSPAARFMASL